MNKDEALKLALEALETPWNVPYVDGCDLALGKRVKAITAIKEALANEALEKMAENARELGLDYEPEQEPVAWLNEEKKIIYWHNTHETDDYHGFKRTTPLYTTPPQRKPLTDEEIQTIAKEHIAVGTRSFEEFVRRIEAAHGIKGEA